MTLATSRGAGLNKLTEPVQKVAQLFTHNLIYKLAIFIEDFMRGGNHQTSAEPRMRAERTEHRQPLGLRHHSAEASG